jgi:hypothetical protein
MSKTPSGNVVKCGCCQADVEEEQTFVDPDLEVPVCPECKINLRYAQSMLCKRDPQGVSHTGMHGPHEQSGPWKDHYPSA